MFICSEVQWEKTAESSPNVFSEMHNKPWMNNLKSFILLLNI